MEKSRLNKEVLEFIIAAKKSQNEPVEFTITTDSMVPIIKIGEIVRVDLREETLNSLNKFDIVVFWQNYKVYCHYIVDFTPATFAQSDPYVFTQGYRSRHLDAPIKKSQLIGKVTSHDLTAWQKWVIQLIR